jgi:predicted Zn-dependent protease with MMP-like domain
MKLPQAKFEELVDDALDDLPPFFHEQMKNIAVVAAGWPSRSLLRRLGVPPGETLLGLYEGVPLTERTHGYNLVSPDLITLFQGPIEVEAAAAAGEEGLSFEESMRRQVRHTVIHEIAHHFGISDNRLRQLGVYLVLSKGFRGVPGRLTPSPQTWPSWKRRHSTTLIALYLPPLLPLP